MTTMKHLALPSRFTTVLILLLSLLLTSCHRHDILEDKRVFCEATINGIRYKDNPTVRELLGPVALPFGTKERFLIGSDTIAYFQFELRNINKQEDFCYLLGGIAFSKYEKFPLLNKKYIIKYDQESEPDRASAYTKLFYLHEQRVNMPDSLPFGITLLEGRDKNGAWMRNYVSLKGSLIFESYNSKKNKYQGSFLLYKDCNETEDKSYEIIGKFDVSIKGNYN